MLGIPINSDTTLGARAEQDIARRGDLLDVPLVHYGYSVGHLFGSEKVVDDEDGRYLEAPEKD